MYKIGKILILNLARKFYSFNQKLWKCYIHLKSSSQTQWALKNQCLSTELVLICWWRPSTSYTTCLYPITNKYIFISNKKKFLPKYCIFYNSSTTKPKWSLNGLHSSNFAILACIPLKYQSGLIYCFSIWGHNRCSTQQWIIFDLSCWLL